METTKEAVVIGTLNELMGVWESRDVEDILSYFAPSPTLCVYGTGADEKRVGLDEVRLQLERDFAQSEAFSVSLDSNIIGVSGDVAWIASDVTIRFRVPGQAEMAFPARLTTVMQDYDGRWLFEQMHLSVAASGQAEGESF